MRRTGRRTHGRLAVFGRGFGAEAHRLFLPQAVHGLGGIVADFFTGTLAQRLQIGLAVAGFDQDLEQHPMRQLALGGARSQHAGDVADVVQPLTGLAAGPMGQELQQQRQVVRQLASIQLEAIAAVRLDQIDHGLAAITRFAMDVFEQQQAHRTTTVETGQPRGLRIQRIGAQQLLHEAAQLLAAGGVQRRVVAGGE
ncbi:hypothetical protein G6F24_014612 [Rhizopus arrhizus]|nr:hypothetical protein G6F24_014612 [Rhizopus arrhizus]